MKTSLKVFSTVHLFLACIALLCSKTASAKDYQLFKSGTQNPMYNEIVKELRPGDRISFSNGKWFSILGLKKNGNTTLVLQVSEEYVIRIPLKSGQFMPQFSGDSVDYRSYIDMFYNGNRKLSRLGVDTVKVVDYLSGEYVVVSKLEIQFTFEEFISGNVSIDHSEKARLLELFYKWAASTRNVTYIGDFNESQVGFDKKTQSWKLFDNTEWVHSIGSFRRANEMQKTDPVYEDVFLGDHFYSLPPPNSIFSEEEIQKIYSEISNRIKSARKKVLSCSKLTSN